MLAFGWARCRRIKATLWDYASERLPEGAMERVEQHLHQCAACTQELDTLKRAQGLLSACRAQEEPAPRSDWSDLRQRIVADGLAHIMNPAPARRNPASLRAARAPWSMQLIASTAGGFAAALVVVVSYHALHLNETHVNETHAAPLSQSSTPLAVSTAPGAAPPRNTATPQEIAATAAATQAGAKETGATDGKAGLQFTTDIVSILGKMRVVTSDAPRSAPVAAVTARAVLNREHYAMRSARQTPQVGGIAKARQDRHLVKNRLTPSARSTSRPENRQPETQQIASLEHVQPVSSESEDVNGYVVGSVLPVSRDDDHDY